MVWELVNFKQKQTKKTIKKTKEIYINYFLNEPGIFV